MANKKTKAELIVKLVLDEIESRTGHLEEIGCQSFDEIADKVEAFAKANKSDAVVTVDLDKHELATVLAALRFWQRWTVKHQIPITEHFEDGAEPLTEDEIDQLCEEINCAEVRP